MIKYITARDVAAAFAGTDDEEELERVIIMALVAEREACAALLDTKAREYNRLRDPGMANHCRTMARLIRERSNSQ